MSVPRRFDHDQARALRAAGFTIADIARAMNVSPARINQVCNPDVALAAIARIAEYQTSGTCPDCGGPSSRNASARRRRGLDVGDGSNRCVDCTHLRHATTVRPDALQCCSCRLWLPDTDFYNEPRNKARRGRKQTCRACENVRRRNYRLTHPEQAEREREAGRERARRNREKKRETA